MLGLVGRQCSAGREARLAKLSAFVKVQLCASQLELLLRGGDNGRGWGRKAPQISSQFERAPISAAAGAPLPTIWWCDAAADRSRHHGPSLRPSFPFISSGRPSPRAIVLLQGQHHARCMFLSDCLVPCSPTFPCTPSFLVFAISVLSLPSISLSQRLISWPNC